VKLGDRAGLKVVGRCPLAGGDKAFTAAQGNSGWGPSDYGNAIRESGR